MAEGFFPLDERWRLTGSSYSERLSQQMVWLSGLVPSFEQAQAVFARIGHRQVPRMSIWRQTQSYAQRLQDHRLEQQARVRPERVVLPPAGQDHGQRKGISMDGGMVHIRDEGWKEFKLGAIYDVVPGREADPLTGEEVEQAQATGILCTGVLGPVDQFGPALWHLAVEQHVPQAADSSVTADGAPWIWNLTADYFPDSVQIVDWYHACQHLAQAAAALHPDDPAAAQRWFKQHQHALFQGQLHVITSALDQADLSDHAHYFHTHKRRLQYLEFRENGYPIGSGTVESLIKQCKLRLTGPGMRWSRSGAQHMLLIRSTVLDQTFDTLWADAA